MFMLFHSVCSLISLCGKKMPKYVLNHIYYLRFSLLETRDRKANLRFLTNPSFLCTRMKIYQANLKIAESGVQTINIKTAVICI